MPEPAHVGLSYAEYLELERSEGVKHEFLDGRVWAMSGGTPGHAAIAANLTGLLYLPLRGGPCRSYTSDLKIRVFETGLATYPDVSVVCGPLEPHPEDPNAVTNPTVLVEVLSPSTEAWDRGAKARHYRRLPSLRHFLLVDPDGLRVELFTRRDDGSWSFVEHAPGGTIRLEAIDLDLRIDDVFADLPA